MDTGLLSLKWNNHGTTFFHVLSTLRGKESYSDVTLACEGKFYPVHKLVLSTCSEYFEEIFNHTQCRQPVIVLKDIRHKELEALLNYMYLGEVNVLQADLAGLIKAAECLKVKGLAVPDEAPTTPRNISSTSSNSCNRDSKRSACSRESPQQIKRLRADDDNHRDSREEREASRFGVSPRNASSSSSSTSSSSSHPTETVSDSSQLCQEPTSRDQREAHQHPPESDNRLAGERLNDAIPSSSPSQHVEIVPNESAVKTELLEEPKDENSTDMIDADNGIAYDPLTPSMQGEGVTDGGQGNFDPQMLASQPQNIEELVAQAMPGTSGMQGDSLGGWGGGQAGGGGGADLSRFSLDAFHMEDADGGTQSSGGPQQQQQQSMDYSLNETVAAASGMMYSVEPGSGGKQCPFCFRTFPFHSYLRRHITLHTKEKRYSCSKCDSHFTRKARLKKHLFMRHGDLADYL